MIDHVWTVLCSRAVVDKTSNNVSLQNVIEQLAVEAEPTQGALIPIRPQVVVLWARSQPDTPVRGRARMTFRGPSGKSFGSIESEINLSEHERFRSIGTLQGFPVEEAGRHWIITELSEEGESEWREVDRIPLTLIFNLPEDESGSEEEEDE